MACGLHESGWIAVSPVNYYPPKGGFKVLWTILVILLIIALAVFIFNHLR